VYACDSGRRMHDNRGEDLEVSRSAISRTE
jgi:hypothetical protein